MKKTSVFLLFFFILASCHKSDSPSTMSEHQISGKLMYEDPAGDGAGLYYKVETTDEILIFNPDASENPLIKYAAFIDVHTRITFKDTGKKGCLNTISGCVGSYRIIDVISVKKE